MTENTRDLMKFGSRERSEAADLLKALSEANDTEYLGDEVAIEFNPNSGNVFLVDEDFNVAMMNGDRLEDFHVSPYEGHEGFISDLVDEQDDTWNQEDIDWLSEIQSNPSDDDDDEQYQKDVSDLADEILNKAIAKGEPFSEGLSNWAISQAEQQIPKP